MPLEPLLLAARNPVIAALGEHQVRVGVLPIRPAAVEGERIGQPLPAAHPRAGGQSARAKNEYIEREGRYAADGDEREHVEHGHMPAWASMTRLMKGLDAFLERDQDLALFDLAPRPKTA